MLLNVVSFTSLGIDCRVADPLAAESRQELVDFVTCPGTTMIFCDGVNKPAEVKAVVGTAKAGDLILAHDYAPRRELFESEIRGKRWSWCKITDADLLPIHLCWVDLAKLCKAMWFCGLVLDTSNSGITNRER